MHFLKEYAKYFFPVPTITKVYKYGNDSPT